MVVSVSLLTALSRPWMCRVTDLAFLLEVFIKNWDFFLCCLTGVHGKGLAGAFRMLNTSLAKAEMSTDSPSLHGDMLYLMPVDPNTTKLSVNYMALQSDHLNAFNP